MDTQELVAALAQHGYEELFLHMDDVVLKQLWDEAGNQEKLANIARDTSLPSRTRFLAAEILFQKDPQYPPQADAAVLAPVYAQALADNGTVNANIWGMPGELDGGTGKHLLRVGAPMVAELVPLLSDETQLYYEGSEEATIGDSYEYRVKDFAAFFISQLRNSSYTVHQTPQERDAEIQQLIKRLGI